MANTTNPYIPKPVYETCVTRIIGEHKCLWYSNYRPDVHKMEKLMESNPDDVKIVLDYRNGNRNDNFGVFARQMRKHSQFRRYVRI